MRVLIADGLSAHAVAALQSTPGIEVVAHNQIPRAELKELIPSVDILIVRSRTQVDRDLLEGARNLKLAIRAGIGLDNIDVSPATHLGVVVMNAPTGNIVTTAEHAIAMLFAVSRQIPAADASMRAGKWEKKRFQGSEIRNKTLGLVGLGNIGKAVAERALGLGMRVVGFDPYLTQAAAAKHRIELVEFDPLLEQSDYVSLHLPLLDTTRHLFNKNTLSKMKKGAYLIHCARGGIVDESALAECLHSGHLRGAALDVFEQEPLPSNHPLLECPGLVLTPHLGASTAEAQDLVGTEVAEQVQAYVRDGALKNAVNVPNVSAAQLESLRPYLVLCERLGMFAAQSTSLRALQKVRVSFESMGPEVNPEVLTLSLLQGFLSHLTGTSVNFVTARRTLKERGIELEQSVTEHCENYSSLVRLTIEAETPLTVAGTLFGKDQPRLVMVNNFQIDAVLSGTLLFTRNEDKPGMIGRMGQVIARHGVNIARMHLGRADVPGEAIALVSIDSALPDPVLEELRSTAGMLSVAQIQL